MNEINIRKLLRITYLLLIKNGLKKISLKDNDLTYISKIEEIITDNNINDKDLLCKNTNYVYFLMELFLVDKIGYLNNAYDSIIIDCPINYINNEIEDNKQYINQHQEIINKLCNVISPTEEEKKYLKNKLNTPNMI